MTVPVRPTLWIITDGKAGDEQPLIGVAEELGVSPDRRHVHPRPPFVWLMPWGPIDPREGPDHPGAPLSPPFPDICLATGRRAVAYLRRLKQLSPTTVTVFFKHPRCRADGADLLVMSPHDRPDGREASRLIVTPTLPNRLPAGRLAALRATPPPALAALPPPRLAVLIGGDSRHHRFTPTDIARLIAGLRARRAAGASLMITASRRTPPPLRAALDAFANADRVFFWNGQGDNPYAAMLALADEVVVTADSTNMIGEAAVTGRPIQVFHPSGGHAKITAFIAELGRHAAIGRFPEAPASASYPPINATPDIAAAILALWQARITPPPARS